MHTYEYVNIYKNICKINFLYTFPEYILIKIKKWWVFIFFYKELYKKETNFYRKRIDFPKLLLYIHTQMTMKDFFRQK